MYKKLALVIVTLCILATRAGNISRRWQQYMAMGVKLERIEVSIFAE